MICRFCRGDIIGRGFNFGRCCYCCACCCLSIAFFRFEWSHPIGSSFPISLPLPPPLSPGRIFLIFPIFAKGRRFDSRNELRRTFISAMDDVKSCDLISPMMYTRFIKKKNESKSFLMRKSDGLLERSLGFPPFFSFFLYR